MGISPREVVRQDADDGKEPEETGEEGAGEDVEAEANVEFKPLIDLPDLVETKTGEEMRMSSLRCAQRCSVSWSLRRSGKSGGQGMSAFCGTRRTRRFGCSCVLRKRWGCVPTILCR